MCTIANQCTLSPTCLSYKSDFWFIDGCFNMINVIYVQRIQTHKPTHIIIRIIIYIHSVSIEFQPDIPAAYY